MEDFTVDEIIEIRFLLSQADAVTGTILDKIDAELKERL